MARKELEQGNGTRFVVTSWMGYKNYHCMKCKFSTLWIEIDHWSRTSTAGPIRLGESPNL